MKQNLGFSVVLYLRCRLQNCERTADSGQDLLSEATIRGKDYQFQLATISSRTFNLVQKFNSLKFGF